MVWAADRKAQERTFTAQAQDSRLQQLYSIAKTSLVGAVQRGPAEVDKLKAALGTNAT